MHGLLEPSCKGTPSEQKSPFVEKFGIRSRCRDGDMIEIENAFFRIEPRQGRHVEIAGLGEPFIIHIGLDVKLEGEKSP